MRYAIAKLQSDVMTRLGEISRPQCQAEGMEVPWPEDVVKLKVASLLGEVGARLIRESPPDLPDSGGRMEPERVAMRLMPCGLHAAEVRLPGGFLRLVSVRMSDWSRGVRSAPGPSSPQWGRQWSAEPGIAGSPDMPRAYLDCDGEGPLLRLVGCRSDTATLESLAVWCVPEPDGSGTFEFPESLYGDLTGVIASRVSP